jgi:hypothetical protein
MTARELLTRLLELTPEPDPEIEVDHLLASFEVIVAKRAAVIALIVPPLRLTADERPLLVELERREAVWQDALAAALRTIGEQRCGAGQLRAYARQGG